MRARSLTVLVLSLLTHSNQPTVPFASEEVVCFITCFSVVGFFCTGVIFNQFFVHGPLRWIRVCGWRIYGYLLKRAPLSLLHDVGDARVVCALVLLRVLYRLLTCICTLRCCLGLREIFQVRIQDFSKLQETMM